MWTKEEFRRNVGMIDVSRITARAPGIDWGWWNYADNILFFGKTDWERAIGIIYNFVPGSEQYRIYGCPPGNPPTYDECILFENKSGDAIDQQDEDICTRALSYLPHASGRMDGIVLQPSSNPYPCSTCGSDEAQASSLSINNNLLPILLGGAIGIGTLLWILKS